MLSNGVLVLLGEKQKHPILEILLRNGRRPRRVGCEVEVADGREAYDFGWWRMLHSGCIDVGGRLLIGVVTW